jgi:hypothetical protein
MREAVTINGANELEDIVLERVSESEFLPPTPDILTQLSDAEWLYNLAGHRPGEEDFQQRVWTRLPQLPDALPVTV